MPPSTRITDMHICPKIEPGPIPHVGGPVLSGAPTVLIGNLPAARVSDSALCVGPTDSIAQGSPTVLIEHQAAARIGDRMNHGGVIVAGFPTVLIGESGQGAAAQAAAAAALPFCEICED